MRFEWDPAKEKTNRKKHKVSFYDASFVFADENMLSIFDETHSEDEDRWITIGQSMKGTILVVVHTYKKVEGKDFVRIISARKATKNEEKQYFERLN